MSLRRRQVGSFARLPPNAILHPVTSMEHATSKSLICGIRCEEVGIIIVLTLVALATRFFRISEPGAVVFDELHFGKFMENYLQGKVGYCVSEHCNLVEVRTLYL